MDSLTVSQLAGYSIGAVIKVTSAFRSMGKTSIKSEIVVDNM